MHSGTGVQELQELRNSKVHGITEMQELPEARFFFCDGKIKRLGSNREPWVKKQRLVPRSFSGRHTAVGDLADFQSANS
jgi:hypothetical protein